MNKWSPEYNVIEESINNFYYKSLQYKVLEKNNDLTLIQIKENEFRSCKEKTKDKKPTMYYSRIIKYKLYGYLLKKNPHAMLDYILCTRCFEKINNFDNCSNCTNDFNNCEYPFFLNSIYFFSNKYYTMLVKRYKLGVHEEHYRDQRNNMSNTMKQEIYAAALHPDKIQRIIDITNDFENIEDYI
jgi:hypothetical protein